MPNTFEKLLNAFDYPFPKELIEQNPVRPRDSARLLVYDKKTKKTFFDTFAGLGKYLPKNAVLVFNHTRVIPARLTVFKETGGKAEILFIGTEGGVIKALSNRKLLPRQVVALSRSRAIVQQFNVV